MKTSSRWGGASTAPFAKTALSTAPLKPAKSAGCLAALHRAASLLRAPTAEAAFTKSTTSLGASCAGLFFVARALLAPVIAAELFSRFEARTRRARRASSFLPSEQPPPLTPRHSAVGGAASLSTANLTRYFVGNVAETGIAIARFRLRNVPHPPWPSRPSPRRFVVLL